MDKLLSELLNLDQDRVRANTDPVINQRLDAETEHRIRLYANQDSAVIDQRLQELDREWDIERFLETNASGLMLGGLLLGATVSRKWFIIPFAVAGFLLQHAVQGYCPPVALLRSRGVRTRREIERERYGLKALRGDFDTALHDAKSGAAREPSHPKKDSAHPTAPHTPRPRRSSS